MGLEVQSSHLFRLQPTMAFRSRQPSCDGFNAKILPAVETPAQLTGAFHRSSGAALEEQNACVATH